MKNILLSVAGLGMKSSSSSCLAGGGIIKPWN
jgi:hypothetical protein